MLETIVVGVEGMSCDHCAGTVKRALLEISGVGSVEVSLDARQVTIALDSSKTDRSACESAISDAGYQII